MVTYIRYKRSYSIMTACLLALLVVSCNKEKQLGEDPYKGREQLGISILTKTTDQTDFAAGESLTVAVKGFELAKYKDTDFKVFVNEILAPLTGRTDTTITIAVPVDASTGSMWITVKDQTYFGPIVKIAGKVDADPQFEIVNGASNKSGFATVFALEQLPNGRFWLGGAFNDFEQNGTETLPIGGIAQLNANGKYIENDIDFGKGVGGGLATIFSLARINSGDQTGKFIIAGNFFSYNSTRTNRQVLRNVARLNDDGTLDSTVVDVANSRPQDAYKNTDTVPTYNAGTNGFIRKAIPYGSQVYLIGDFTNYTRIFYENSTYDQKYYDITRIRQLVRTNEDGSLDSSFHYNKALRQSPIGANGGILDAIMQSDGKLILVGSFTTFNGSPANRIVRLNLDGSKDNSFNVGSGADGDIYSIRYNGNTNKIVLSGIFTTFNGKSASGVNLLNSDGSNDIAFMPLQITGGLATFAGQLNSGKIIVAGSFSKYGNYIRQGFMILDSDGKLAVGYNNTGGFTGRIYDMDETPLVSGSRVTLVGDILRFNTILPHNVLRIIVKN